MFSKITSKYQTTIPKAIREKFKLHISDTIEWKIQNNLIVIEPGEKPFLKYQGKIKTGAGNIKEDIQEARNKIAKKYS
jgi:AbrB family looped-hinge helix DNA binding protein